MKHSSPQPSTASPQFASALTGGGNRLMGTSWNCSSRDRIDHISQCNLYMMSDDIGLSKGQCFEAKKLEHCQAMGKLCIFMNLAVWTINHSRGSIHWSSIGSRIRTFVLFSPLRPSPTTGGRCVKSMVEGLKRQSLNCQ
jgi:hypothetical protein